MKKRNNFLAKIWAMVKTLRQAEKPIPNTTKKEAKSRAFKDMMEEGVDPYILNGQQALKELEWDF